MATITEDYVSFEISKLLKKKGFDIPCLAHWFIGTNRNFSISNTSQNWNEIKTDLDWLSCPTHQMAMKWLREVHGLHISLEPYYDYDSMHVVFLAFVQNVADVHEFMDGRKNVASHPNAEKSYELAIKYCLENLI